MATSFLWVEKMRILLIMLMTFVAFGCTGDDGTREYNVLDEEAEAHLEESYVSIIIAAEFMESDMLAEADAELDRAISEERQAKQKLEAACEIAEKNPKLECYQDIIDEIGFCLIPQAQFLKKQVALFESINESCDADCIQQKCDDYLNEALVTDQKCSQSPLEFDPETEGMYIAAVEVCNHLLSP